jgi:hypothetical protein
MSVFLRLAMMAVGYGLACLAGSFVFTVGMFAPHWNRFDVSDLPPEALAILTLFGTPFIWVLALLPALSAIALAEALAWRSVVIYAALGGAVALILSYGIDLPGDLVDPATFFSHEREVLAASGIAGGLVYWLFAGRRAGELTRGWAKSA